MAEIKTDAWLGISGNVNFEVLRINHTAHPDKAGTLVAEILHTNNFRMITKMSQYDLLSYTT